MVSKSKIAIMLSQLQLFKQANFKQEQYPTDSEVAAETLWLAYMKGDIEGKIIADFGCGTGVLGIAALLLGAEKVYFVDKDNEALEILEQNLAELEYDNYEVMNKDIGDTKISADVVLENPPFGTRQKHADREFLLKAFETARVVYSFHKTSTSKFVEKISKDYGFRIAERRDFKFPLKNTMEHHKSKIKRIDVTMFLLEKNSAESGGS